MSLDRFHSYTLIVCLGPNGRLVSSPGRYIVSYRVIQYYTMTRWAEITDCSVLFVHMGTAVKNASLRK